MSQVFQFGEQVEGFSVRVLNERAVRAAAGILFFPALVAFMNAWLIGNYQPIRLFVVLFLIDFTIRIFINPRYAPSLIVGQWVVRKQQPEWSGAPQKRFAWAIGFILALVMAYTMVFNGVIGPINFISCAICLTLMFFESAFGICIGCKLYNMLSKNQAQLCPGGVCDLPPAKTSGTSWGQIAMVALFTASISGIAPLVYSTGTQQTGKADMHTATAAAKTQSAAYAAPAASPSIDPAEAERCKVPEFAKKMGHEDKWKLHNNCK
ncbi:MAG: DUF4395 domain-containing protein [Burkholderiaceae bacterium]|nr:DUF4395 domain-containing protein [Burkholderiaceae bacterium]